MTPKNISFPSSSIYESFTLPIFDLTYNFNHKNIVNEFLDTQRSNPSRNFVGQKSIYIHIPFCDEICSFCPFIKSIGTDQRVENYITALLEEIKIMSNKAYFESWHITNVYFGGGTPSVLSSDQFERIIVSVREKFSLSKNCEISVEVEPKSVTEEKFQTYQKHGVTRVSWGVQSLDPKIREMVNLTATEADIHRTLELSKKYFTNDNFDMIVGFPGQTVEESIKDVEAAAKLGARTMSIYPLDYVTVLPKMLDRIRSGKLPPVPSSEVRWDSFYESRDVLKNFYEEQNMYCFGKEGIPECLYMFQSLYGTYDDETLGLGCGAYSSMMGMTHLNIMDEKAYVNSLQNGELPIQQSCPGHTYEKAMVYFPKKLKLDLSHYRSLDLEGTYSARIDFLLSSEYAYEKADFLHLTEKGKRSYIDIMVFMMSDYQRRLYERTCARLKKELNWGDAGPVTSIKSEAKKMGVINTMNI